MVTLPGAGLGVAAAADPRPTRLRSLPLNAILRQPIHPSLTSASLSRFFSLSLLPPPTIPPLHFPSLILSFLCFPPLCLVFLPVSSCLAVCCSSLGSNLRCFHWLVFLCSVFSLPFFPPLLCADLLFLSLSLSMVMFSMCPLSLYPIFFSFFCSAQPSVFPSSCYPVFPFSYSGSAFSLFSFGLPSLLSHTHRLNGNLLFDFFHHEPFPSLSCLSFCSTDPVSLQHASLNYNA